MKNFIIIKQSDITNILMARFGVIVPKPSDCGKTDQLTIRHLADQFTSNDAKGYAEYINSGSFVHSCSQDRADRQTSVTAITKAVDAAKESSDLKTKYKEQLADMLKTIEEMTAKDSESCVRVVRDACHEMLDAADADGMGGCHLCMG